MISFVIGAAAGFAVARTPVGDFIAKQAFAAWQKAFPPKPKN